MLQNLGKTWREGKEEEEKDTEIQQLLLRRGHGRK